MSEDQKLNPGLMNKQEIAKFCGVSLPTVNRWMKNGKIRYLKVGRRVLFIRTQIVEDLEKFTVQQAIS